MLVGGTLEQPADLLLCGPAQLSCRVPTPRVLAPGPDTNSILTVSVVGTVGYRDSWLQLLVANTGGALFIVYLYKGLAMVCLARAPAKLVRDKEYLEGGEMTVTTGENVSGLEAALHMKYQFCINLRLRGCLGICSA